MNTIKPKLRYDAKTDMHGALHGAISGAITATFSKPDNYPFQSCLNCKHFTEATELCKLYEVRPPARVIVYGCDGHSDILLADKIPY